MNDLVRKITWTNEHPDESAPLAHARMVGDKRTWGDMRRAPFPA